MRKIFTIKKLTFNGYNKFRGRGWPDLLLMCIYNSLIEVITIFVIQPIEMKNCIFPILWSNDPIFSINFNFYDINEYNNKIMLHSK